MLRIKPADRFAVVTLFGITCFRGKPALKMGQFALIPGVAHFVTIVVRLIEQAVPSIR